MLNSPIFEKPILKSDSNFIQLNRWDGVMNLYKEKKYKDTLIATLNYINEKQVKKYGNEDENKFVFRQGSIKIYVDIDDEKFSVKAPFLKIGEGPTIPLLRQVAELNFNTLVLAQIFLEEDVLEFRFESEIDNVFPYKLYDLFRDICHIADSFDDFFINKFKAEKVEELEVKELSSEVIDKTYNQFKEYLQETLDYANEYGNQRYWGFVKEIVTGQFQKIDYCIKPQGFLKSEVEKNIKKIRGCSYNPNDIQQVMEDINNSIDEFLKISKDEFAESVYETEIFIPEKSKMDLNGVKNYYKKTIENAKKDIASNAFAGSCLFLFADTMGLFYYNDLPLDITEKLESVLEESSQKNWKESTDILLKGIEEVINS